MTEITTKLASFQGALKVVGGKSCAVQVLKPLEKLDLPDKTEVRITIKQSFSKLLDEIGEIEAREDVDSVLKEMRERKYYE